MEISASEIFLFIAIIALPVLNASENIHTQSQIGIVTQNGISNSGAYFTDLYMSKYKYIIMSQQVCAMSQ